MMGSFFRTGNYPIEANYIFKSEDELIQFYSIPENKAILHKGLMKVVANEDSQSLYWVVQEGEELKFVKLIDQIDINHIKEQVEDILFQLNDKDDTYNKILGTPTPSDKFKTLRGIEDIVVALTQLTKNRDENLQSEIDQIQIGVGLSGDGAFNADQETYYLKNATSIMNALKTLDSLLNQALTNGGQSVDYEERISSLESDTQNLETYIQEEITRATNKENNLQSQITINKNNITNINNQVSTIKNQMLKMAFVSQAQYDALSTKDSMTNYAIINNGKIVKMYTGVYQWDICNLFAEDLPTEEKEEHIFYGYIINDTITSFNQITYEMIQEAVSNKTLIQSDVNTLPKTSLGIVPLRAWIFVAIPRSSNYIATKDNGIGGKMMFSEEVVGTNGNVISTFDTIEYKIYGEYSTTEGERFIYID